jgi:hypothetical protein
MPRKDYSDPDAPPAKPEACEECGGKLGYDPNTGIDLKQGHYSSCSKWVQ